MSPPIRNSPPAHGGAAARASATLAEIRQTDQRALMAPLRTGVPGARRALAETRALLRDACA